MVVAEGEHLILVNGAELLDDRGRLIPAVCFMKIENLCRASQREKQDTWSNEKTDVLMPLPDSHESHIE
jgi:hypothetical protein